MMQKKKPNLYAAVVVLMLTTCSGIEGRERDLYVRSQSSCHEYDLDVDGEINLIFPGFPPFGLDDCKIEIKADNSYDRICVKAKDLDLDCGIELEVHAGIVTSIPDKTYSCSSMTFSSEYCSYLDSLTIIVKQTSSSLSSNAKLKVYPKESEFDVDFTDIAQTAVVGVYVIVGIVVGGIILLVIVVVIVICCCCKRQSSSSGTVYRNQQPASQPAPGAYPQVQYTAVSPQAAGYQPPAQGYQPPAQGYQPPAQPYQPPPGQLQGYQPQAGYQPPPQGYSAPPPAQGYQMSETQKMPSAPMLEKDPMAPPPYPGH